MPTRNGTPYNWIDIHHDQLQGVQQSAIMRGQPEALAYWQGRPFRGPQAVPQPGPYYIQSRPYSRGAGAFSPHFGALSYNPIGAGVYSPYKLPPCAGPGARYVQGAIFFGVQAISTGLRMNATVPIETVDALIATSHVAASYRTT